LAGKLNTGYHISTKSQYDRIILTDLDFSIQYIKGQESKLADLISRLYRSYRIDLDDWKEAKRAFTVEERLPGKKRRTYRKNNKENLPKLQMSPTSLDTTLQPKAKQEASTETMMATTRSQTKASSSTSESEKKNQ